MCDLHYNPETGVFTKNGKPVGWKNTVGYWSVRFNVFGKKHEQAHRVAFYLMTGRMPVEVDHINGDKLDNRWVNLREVTSSVNKQNARKARVNNKTGLLGVCYKPKRNKYHAQIVVNRRHYHLGYYDTAEEAHEAYLEAKRKMHEGCTI